MSWHQPTLSCYLPIKVYYSWAMTGARALYRLVPRLRASYVVRPSFPPHHITAPASPRTVNLSDGEIYLGAIIIVQRSARRSSCDFYRRLLSTSRASANNETSAERRR